MKYILASGSPRRKELLELMGMEQFKIIPSHKEEVITKTEPSEIVEELSYQKCMDIANQLVEAQKKVDYDNPLFGDVNHSFVVIGADTVVADQEKVLGKPKDEAEAFIMLKGLAGHAHSVFTGVTIALVKNGKLMNDLTFHEETKVYMREYTDVEINRYIETKDPMDKAGSYGIQTQGAILVEKIEGDYNNVVGLPITKLYCKLQKESYI